MPIIEVVLEAGSAESATATVEDDSVSVVAVVLSEG